MGGRHSKPEDVIDWNDNFDPQIPIELTPFSAQLKAKLDRSLLEQKYYFMKNEYRPYLK